MVVVFEEIIDNVCAKLICGNHSELLIYYGDVLIYSLDHCNWGKFFNNEMHAELLEMIVEYYMDGLKMEKEMDLAAKNLGW